MGRRPIKEAAKSHEQAYSYTYIDIDTHILGRYTKTCKNTNKLELVVFGPGTFLCEQNIIITYKELDIDFGIIGYLFF